MQEVILKIKFYQFSHTKKEATTYGNGNPGPDLDI
jgi:hypothetical protein